MSSVSLEPKNSFQTSSTANSSERLNNQLLSYLQTTAKSASDPASFGSHISALHSFIPEDYHGFLSLEVLTAFLLAHFPEFETLSSVFKSHLSVLFHIFLSSDLSHLQKLNELTQILVALVKENISNMIGQDLKPYQVFILLTCTELFQNISRFPLPLLISAVMNCHMKSPIISRTEALPSIYSLLCSATAPYLPNYKHKNFTLVLDLDETLGHLTKGVFLVRPGVEKFLEKMNEIFELVLFTASSREYADWAMEKVDPKKFIALRLYREHTINNEIKDLNDLGRSLENVLIIDNFPQAYQRQPSNGYHIKSWTGDLNDKELERLGILLSKAGKAECKNIVDLIHDIL